jgi:hypothetical protein
VRATLLPWQTTAEAGFIVTADTIGTGLIFTTILVEKELSQPLFVQRALYDFELTAKGVNL